MRRRHQSRCPGLQPPWPESQRGSEPADGGTGWMGLRPQQGTWGGHCPAGAETLELELQVQTGAANSLAEIANHRLRKRV